MADKLTNFPNGVESAVGFFGPVHGSVTNTAIAALTPVSTANATDLPTAQALANANKTAINAIIAALQS